MSPDVERDKVPEMLATARTLKANGASIDEILEQLRLQSSSIIQSIKCMKELLGISMGEAKLLVHRSRTWSDMRDPFSELHATAEKEYENRTDSDGTVRIRLDKDSSS